MIQRLRLQTNIKPAVFVEAGFFIHGVGIPLVTMRRTIRLDKTSSSHVDVCNYIQINKFEQTKNDPEIHDEGEGRGSDDIHAHWQLTEDAQPMLFQYWYTICGAQQALN